MSSIPEERTLHCTGHPGINDWMHKTLGVASGITSTVRETLESPRLQADAHSEVIHECFNA